MALGILYRNKKVSDLIWSIRALFGQTSEGQKAKYFQKKTAGLIRDYMNGPGMKKLNIGCQGNNLEGWLNTDVWAGPEGVAYLDATKRFPFENESFECVMSEHMIEHIAYEQAVFMLGECHRILKKGGKIRIATPSLDRFISMKEDDPVVQDYFREHVSKTYPHPVPCKRDFLVNYIFYNFYHKFIFGKESLTHLLQVSGFRDIRFYPPGISDDTRLQDVERHQVCLGEAFNNLETLIAEAVKG